MPLTGTIEGGVTISSWWRSWSLTVGTGVLIWVSLVSLMLTLTMFILDTLTINIRIIYYSMMCLKRLSIAIWIQGQPERHQREPGKAHRLSLWGNVRQHISPKKTKKLQNGRFNTYHNQGRWRICQMKKMWMFSLCRMEDPDNEHWHCNTKSGR